MVRWTLFFADDAEDDLAHINKPIRRRIIDKLEWLCNNFDNVDPLPLGNQWRGFFKLRIGSWRVIYEVDFQKGIIKVRYIDLRDKVYKRIK